MEFVTFSGGGFGQWGWIDHMAPQGARHPRAGAPASLN